MNNLVLPIILLIIVVVFFVLAAFAIDGDLDDDNSNTSSKHNNKSSSNYSIKTNKPKIIPPITEIRGIEGEEEVRKHLKKLLKNDEYLFSNLLLPLKNGHETEIDCVLLSRKGIFCIEIKNWIGHITGDDSSECWIQEYDDPTMEDKEHRNPYKQNESHCEILEKTLDNDIRVKNIVLFPIIEDRTNLYSNFTYEIKEFIIYYRSLKDEIYEEDLQDIASRLEIYEATPEQLQKHKEYMKNIYGSN